MKHILCIVLLFLLQPLTLWSAEYQLTFKDSLGNEITLTKEPKRVVSLVPSVTEMLMRIGGEAKVIGITHHSVLPPGTAGKTIIGGFFRPDMERVAALEPDLIFYADLQEKAVAGFRGRIPLVCLSTGSLAESVAHLKLLGRMFNRETEAARIIAEQQRLMDVIASKTAGIAAHEKQRVVRLMGRDRVMAPGDDSFQNEYIREAGGSAPKWGKNGAVVPVSLAEWQAFNPQFIYGCGDDRQALQLLEQPGWRDVDAVRNGRHAFYPCDLTCRASTHSGYFVSWLSADIYSREYSDPARQVLAEQIVGRSAVPIDLEYVAKAEIIQSDIRDFRNKSVVLTFDRPMKVVSTLEGERQGISHIGNHYFPPPSWGLGHEQGISALRKHTLEVLGLSEDTTSFLFTGADMDNLAVVRKTFREMEVTALVTAGVASNAVRMSADEGSYYEPDSLASQEKPGTINILLLTNIQLSSRAMTRAIISATEAKTAALQDLDIRSSYTGKINPATGTGTDNILVAEGTGIGVDSSGGHTKLGELIARAVYDGVQQAVSKQNGFTEKRSIFQRMKERKTSIQQLGSRFTDNAALSAQLERLLLDPAYSSFLESALAISDDYERGLIHDLTGFDTWCRAITAQLAGKHIEPVELEDETLPVVLRKALGALLSGLHAKS